MDKLLIKLLIKFLSWIVRNIILEVVRDFVIKFFEELRPYSLGNTFQKSKLSRFNKIMYIVSVLIHICLFYCISTDTNKLNIVFALFAYFAYRAAFKEIVEEITRRRYNKFTEMFNGKAKIIKIKKNKKLRTIDFTIFSFIPIDKIISKKLEIEHYLNTNIVDSVPNKYNKKLLTLVTSKNKIVEKQDNSTFQNKLVNILNSYNFNANYKKVDSNDFYENYYIDCNTDIKKILNKVDDIAYKLLIDSSRLEIKVDLGVFIFQIKKEEQGIYYFVDYIDNVKVDKNHVLPVLLGMNQKTSKCIVEDIHNIKHILIIGMNGSGKSSTLNSVIQSTMYLHGSTYSKYVMYDHKKTELNQYRYFINTTYLQTTQQLLKAIIDLDKLMESRGKLFDESEVKDIKKYNSKYPSKKLPFIYFIIDEFSAMMKNLSMSDKDMAKQINEKLITMVNLCRFAGIRIIISTQKPTGGQIDTDIISQLQTKMIHKITKLDKKVLMIEEDVHKLKTGEFILETENYTTKMKGLFIDDENKKYNKVYEILKEKYTSKEDSKNVN